MSRSATFASPEKAEAVVTELKARGVNARAFKADQASAKDVTQLVNDVAKEFGHLDILVNNAGVASGGAIDDANADTEALARQDAINVHGVIAAIRAASQLMGEGGRIVTVGSMLADRASFPGLADYVATKAAVVGYTKGAARDLGPRGITVNVVQPGSIDTDMNPKDGGEFAETSSASSTRCSASAAPRKSRLASCSSQVRKPPSSPARCSTSTAVLAPDQGAIRQNKELRR
ncbi:NAD(P)-dependent dehydrogenase (short-subunit alcohol dehydrogenase family) [Bradyrhizobium sp. GM5.1]